MNEVNIMSDNTSDSCFAYLFQKGRIFREINIGDIIRLNRTPDERNLFYDVYLPPNNYTIVLEGLLDYPVLFTNIKIKKKKMHFLPIDIEELISLVVIRPRVIVIDYKTNLSEYVE